MPDGDDEASQYVRLAIRAYPELYFARFVILGEGDSERLVIPRVAEAMDIQLDPSFVPIVPLGGRYVSHFWRLLNDLRIPHATLLDLDLGRAHGGAALIADVVAKLGEIGNDLRKNSLVVAGTIDPDEVDDVEDADLLDEGEDNHWLKALREQGIFFSFPLDTTSLCSALSRKAIRARTPEAVGRAAAPMRSGTRKLSPLDWWRSRPLRRRL